MVGIRWVLWADSGAIVQLIVQLRSAGFDMGGYHDSTLEKSTGAISILLDNEGRRGE
jgi:hypothetical protein